MKKIAILASSDGLNAERLVRTFHNGNRFRVDIILTDRENAGVIARLESLGVPVSFYPHESWRSQPSLIADTLAARGIDLIVTDRFSRSIPAPLLDAFPGRVLDFSSAPVGDNSLSLSASIVGQTSPVLSQVIPVGDNEAESAFFLQAVYTALRALPPSDAAAVESVAVESVAEVSTSVTEAPAPAPQSVDQAWAERLGVSYDPARIAPPPLPGQVPPPLPQQPTSSHNAFSQPLHDRQLSSAIAEPMPPTYLLWSVLALILCCLIPGIVALIFSAQVSSRYYQGDLEGSRRASRNAEIWIIVSFVLGVLSATLYIPFLIIS